MDFIIKKNQIAINPADARTSRFTGGERIDCAISEIDFEKRKSIFKYKIIRRITKKRSFRKIWIRGFWKKSSFFITF